MCPPHCHSFDFDIIAMSNHQMHANAKANGGLSGTTQYASVNTVSLQCTSRSAGSVPCTDSEIDMHFNTGIHYYANARRKCYSVTTYK